MKQRITIEQLNELTIEQTQKLRELWRPQDFDLVVCGEETLIVEVSGEEIVEYQNSIAGLDNGIPLLTIGQMIDILARDESEDPCQLFLLSPSIETWTTHGMCDELWILLKRIL